MNKTIETQLNHRSIRKFKDIPLDRDTVSMLVDVAQRTSTSSFMQGMSIISITDPEKKKKIAEIGRQHYIAESGHLFIFVLDNFRNNQIAKEKGVETDKASTTSNFLSSFSDCLLACQNVLLAAESIDIGGVILGSILNDAEAIIDLLNLPPLTFPVIGLALGYPDQSPQLKPRMPQTAIHFENEYTVFDDYHKMLAEYDSQVTEYYDLRDANKRIDSFTNQVEKSQNSMFKGRLKLKDTLLKQGLIKR